MADIRDLILSVSHLKKQYFPDVFRTEFINNLTNISREEIRAALIRDAQIAVAYCIITDRYSMGSRRFPKMTIHCYDMSQLPTRSIGQFLRARQVVVADTSHLRKLQKMVPMVQLKLP